jgi:hypothetical protein
LISKMSGSVEARGRKAESEGWSVEGDGEESGGKHDGEKGVACLPVLAWSVVMVQLDGKEERVTPGGIGTEARAGKSKFGGPLFCRATCCLSPQPDGSPFSFCPWGTSCSNGLSPIFSPSAATVDNEDLTFG